ncbi:MAG: Asp-tRNA(Asn)/Glu-tRNA(Gln) amidotransferase subunit GatA [Gemmatimonas sp.]|uniref:Asp-tRNA(Asn)/Glu-tRNA(Gln) amidotransferase subunit GatA n=1 Tax=Gemmatimonas sp. TaxID=1962908 RepID=UPI0025BF973B|nr:Asp-tRNA(Asn)/Glu-tRNA(Gln) amidotransferase subunit GatA [Gemmatimonas sp.]MCE2954842.1 Asp-tRNA(Asn)/Glu-tRNA(Gln) amidotransferase subunit GatA [Gemmatimonas sp.]
MSDHPALGTLRAHRVADAWAAFDAVCAGADGLNAFLAVDREATGLDVGPLAGVPVAIKDNLATHELPTTCGSRVLEGYMSPFEATAVRRLRDAGAAILGKTNMDEFAMGSSNENSAFGPVRNPLDRTRVPGGSSGGSAAAVAAGVVRLALGSETGGSVRQPAAFCGIVGVKPTYGRVSRYGLVAYASSLDHVGVFGRTVGDAAAGLQIIAGHDRFDATSAPHAVPEFLPPTVDGASADPRPLAGLVIGRPVEYFPASLDARIAAHCRHALTVLESLGAEIRDVSLPSTDLAIPVYYIIAPAEASSNLARYDGVRYGRRAMADDLGAMYERTRSEGFGAEVTRRILLGTYVLSAGYYDAYYRRAQAVRELIRQEFSQVFASGVHLLFTPTAPTPAFRIGEVSDPYEMYLSDIFTVTANLVGIPAMSQPIGRVDGLPIGGQFMAPHFTEPTMLRAAAALERALGAEAHQ